MRTTSRLAAVFALAAASSLSAQTLTYDIELRGEQEAPPVTTSGLGTARITLNVLTGLADITGSYFGTSANVVAAHLHGASRRGANSGVIFGLQATGGTTGSFSGQGILSGSQLADLQAGLTYINVHTTANPGGELRGQIDVVPDTGTGQNAPPMSIDGAATGGGTLNLGCPPGLGSFFVLVGVPGAGSQLPNPIACSMPTTLALNINIPIVVQRAPSLAVRIPAGVGTGTVAFQCGQLDLNRNCIVLSSGHHVRITP